MRTLTSRTQLFSFSVHKKILLLFGTVLFITSCGTKTKDQVTPPEGMCRIELSKYGKPFSIFVPDTSNHPFYISEEGSGALIIKSGNGFAISITEETADLQLKRTDVESDEINKFKTYIVNEPNAIFWESAITEPEYHFIINSKIAGRAFCFQDVSSTETKPPGKSSVQMMFNNCQSIQELSK